MLLYISRRAGRRKGIRRVFFTGCYSGVRGAAARFREALALASDSIGVALVAAEGMGTFAHGGRSSRRTFRRDLREVVTEGKQFWCI